MLRIINAFNALPESLEHDIKSSIHPGKFVFLYKGKLNISDGFNIYGICDDIIDKKIKLDTTAGSGRLAVWTGRLVLETDIFEHEFDSKFLPYQEVYIRKGRITPIKWHNDLIPAGIYLGLNQRQYSKTVTIYKYDNKILSNR